MLHAINSRESDRYDGPRRTFSTRSHATYAFAEFELDEARFELRKHGVVVVLQPKALRLLLHLLVQRDRAVSTDELFAELWPGERVSTASIKRAVLGARRALGESGESQRSIRTVRGYGYQFALPVRVLSSHRSAVSPAPAPAPEGARVSIELTGLTRSELADMLGKFYGSALPEARLSGRVVLCLDQPSL
jgi:DNA-binding winged helix-turn-helix (wHTH) protein